MLVPGGSQQSFLLAPPPPDQVVAKEGENNNHNLFASSVFDGSRPALEEGLNGGSGSGGAGWEDAFIKRRDG